MKNIITIITLFTILIFNAQDANIKKGYYSSVNGKSKPLEGFGDILINITGNSGIGTPITILYLGAAKPYNKCYKKELNNNPVFLNKEFKKNTNPWYNVGPK